MNIEDLYTKFTKLENELKVLKNDNWASTGSKKYSAWFVLVNTHYKAETPEEIEYAKRACDEMMQEFKEELPRLLTYNKKGHGPFLIDKIVIKYVVEMGLKRKKTVHIHIYIQIWHRSNLTLTQEVLKEFFSRLCSDLLGSDNPFVPRPRLIHSNRVEEYMAKGGGEIVEI